MSGQLVSATAADDSTFSTSTPINVTLTTDLIYGMPVLTYGMPVVERSRVWTHDVIQRVATLVPLMVVTLLGNAVTMVVLTCSRYRSVNSRINIFIVNLAVGDLAVCCFTMSTEVHYRLYFTYLLTLFLKVNWL